MKARFIVFSVHKALLVIRAPFRCQWMYDYNQRTSTSVRIACLQCTMHQNVKLSSPGRRGRHHVTHRYIS